MTVNDDSVTAQDTQDRARQDSEVKRKRPVVHVPDIASQSSSQGVSLRPWTCAQSDPGPHAHPGALVVSHEGGVADQQRPWGPRGSCHP